MTTEWDISGNCQNSFETDMIGRPEANSGQKSVTIEPGGKSTLRLRLLTRCRSCEACLKHRAALWRARATAETKAATRTWFGTLTLTPEAQFKALNEARQDIAIQGLDYDALKPDDQFRVRHRMIGPDITKWLKRVRKNSGAPLKYLLVAEAHKSGDPHYHVLIHERSIDLPVRHKVLTTAWRLGFTKFNLIDNPNQATYLCKYLSKSLRAKVRASQAYGKSPDFVTPLGVENEVNVITPDPKPPTGDFDCS